MRSKLNKFVLVMVVGTAQLAIPFLAHADGMPPEETKTHVKKQPPTHYSPPPVEITPAPVARQEAYAPVETAVDESCEWKVRLSPGVTVWFFDKENTLPGPSAFLDFWRTDIPINYHVGIEGRHMHLGQDAAAFAMENPDKTTRVTYMRIPFAVEYMHPLAEQVMLYAGGGPDIIHTANDLEDTSVGMHLATRVHYAFTKHWGTALEAGYMWDSVDGASGGSNVNLDGAYITPTISYTF